MPNKDASAYDLRQVPITQIESDPDQPRRDFHLDEDQRGRRLLDSIRTHGVLQPLIVQSISNDRNMIIDGLRRYLAAQRAGLRNLPCVVISAVSSAERETIRNEAQNNREPWSPRERLEMYQRIKRLTGLKTNRELAQHIHLSESVVANLLQLGKETSVRLDAIERHALSSSYQVEYLRIKAKLRKVGDFDIDRITKIILDKINHRVIQNAKDLRILGKVFLKANTNENALLQFLSDPDMSIRELFEELPSQSLPAARSRT
jgi:ParB/RepB/Spo0J family partition protein